jgi:hypothetical protein
VYKQVQTAFVPFAAMKNFRPGDCRAGAIFCFNEKN